MAVARKKCREGIELTFKNNIRSISIYYCLRLIGVKSNNIILVGRESRPPYRYDLALESCLETERCV